MPPKSKFTKEEIVQAALSIVREDGMETLTARTLGARLGSSARPIFTIFKSMEDVQREVIEESNKLYKRYIKDYIKDRNGFMSIGLQYIKFATQEPKLFQLLFMTEKESVPSMTSILSLIDDNYEEVIEFIKNDYKLDESSAQSFYRHLFIYTHGIATLCVTKTCFFTEDEIRNILNEIADGLYKEINWGR